MIVIMSLIRLLPEQSTTLKITPLYIIKWQLGHKSTWKIIVVNTVLIQI